MSAELEKVFKALADPTRRQLLDRLHERNGQTLGELCERLEMARQSVTQHLSVLEAANLVSSVRRGRERLHYLNPVPLGEIQERWIHKFETPRLAALGALKRRAERLDFTYAIYIGATPERVREALTDISSGEVTFEVEPRDGIVRLAVTERNLADQAERDEAADRWAAALSNLKSLLETGHPLSRTDSL